MPTRKQLVVLILFGSALFVGEGGTMGRTEEQQPLMKIYFAPFGVETYEAISQKNIEKNCIHEIWIYENNDLIKKIKSHFGNAKPTNARMDDKVIRLKIIITDQSAVYFVDKEGTGVQPDGNRFTLDVEQLDKIENLIYGLAGVVDVRVVSRSKRDLR